MWYLFKLKCCTWDNYKTCVKYNPSPCGPEPDLCRKQRSVSQDLVWFIEKAQQSWFQEGLAEFWQAMMTMLLVLNPSLCFGELLLLSMLIRPLSASLPLRVCKSEYNSVSSCHLCLSPFPLFSCSVLLHGFPTRDIQVSGRVF